MKAITPAHKPLSSQNDLYRDGRKLTQERVLEHIKLADEIHGTSTVVDLNRKDIPNFLYNKDGKLT